LVKVQGHRIGFSNTLPLHDKTVLIAAARPIDIGQCWRHCYKYCSMSRRLLQTALVLC